MKASLEKIVTPPEQFQGLNFNWESPFLLLIIQGNQVNQLSPDVKVKDVVANEHFRRIVRRQATQSGDTEENEFRKLIHKALDDYLDEKGRETRVTWS